MVEVFCLFEGGESGDETMFYDVVVVFWRCGSEEVDGDIGDTRVDEFDGFRG